MRTAPLVLGGLLLAACGQTQQLRGGFATAKGERRSSYEVFYFDGNQFTYQFIGCFNRRIGKGTYTLTGDRLILSFRQMAVDTLRRVRPFAVAATSPPTFRVRVSTEYRPLPGMLVRSRLNARESAQTDDTGTATLRYTPAPTDELLVEVSDGPVKIPLRTAASQGFMVRAAPSQFFALGESLTFQVRRGSSPNMLLLTTPLLDGPDTARPPDRYERLTAAEVQKWLAQLPHQLSLPLAPQRHPALGAGAQAVDVGPVGVE